MPCDTLAAKEFADRVGVKVETVRDYQRRGLLEEPSLGDGCIRGYSETHLQRMRLIKRAQDMGFTLNDVAELVSMSNAGQRKRLQEIAGARVTDIRQKIAELESVANNLDAQIEICASTAPLQACPIMTSLGGDAGVPDAPGFDSQSGEAKPEPARGIKGKFSSRELEVLRWTAEGKTSAEIGQILHISERAVIFHVNNSMTKLRATNRTQAAVKAVCLGLIVFRPKLTADMPLF